LCLGYLEFYIRQEIGEFCGTNYKRKFTVILTSETVFIGSSYRKSDCDGSSNQTICMSL
jgi:hypothetical protein